MGSPHTKVQQLLCGFMTFYFRYIHANIRITYQWTSCKELIIICFDSVIIVCQANSNCARTLPSYVTIGIQLLELDAMRERQNNR